MFVPDLPAIACEVAFCPYTEDTARVGGKFAALAAAGVHAVKAATAGQKLAKSGNRRAPPSRGHKPARHDAGAVVSWATVSSTAWPPESQPRKTITTGAFGPPFILQKFIKFVVYNQSMFLIQPIRNFYGRFERPISSFSLIFGFVFDAITLKRVDTLWENIWILGHLLVVGIFILLIHLHDTEPGNEKNPQKAHFWYVNILQFFFGGILSTYLVFYFRSADILVTWPFVFILLLAFIANESMKRHYVRLSFQISLFFLSIYAFAIFLIPVILHQIGTKIFLLSGLISLIFISLFIIILFRFTKDNFAESKKLVISLVVGIFVLVNLLYFANLLPPIPLSLKDAGVYYSIQKTNTGNYLASYEKKSWWHYFRLYPDFNKAPGTPTYAFSAIFSPSNLDTTIVHEWQHYNENQEEWITDKVINLPVIGGRDGGFRTYSMRSNLGTGKWRINIKTIEGKTIGHLRFNVLLVNKEPELATMIR